MMLNMSHSSSGNVKSFICSSMADVGDWLEKVYPKVNLDSKGYFFNYGIDKMNGFLGMEQESLYDVDMTVLSSNLYNTGIDIGKVIYPSSNIMTVGDIRTRVVDIFTSSLRDFNLPPEYQFLRDNFSRGIIEPYYFISTLLELLTLSIREENYNNVESLTEFGEDILSKFFLSWICSLRTGFSKEFNLLYRYINDGKFDNINLDDLFRNYFLEDFRFLTLMSSVYNELMGLVRTMHLEGNISTFRSLSEPDYKDGISRNYLFQFYLVKE